MGIHSGVALDTDLEDTAGLGRILKQNIFISIYLYLAFSLIPFLSSAYTSSFFALMVLLSSVCLMASLCGLLLNFPPLNTCCINKYSRGHFGTVWSCTPHHIIVYDIGAEIQEAFLLLLLLLLVLRHTPALYF